jgi:hypothetical protein
VPHAFNVNLRRNLRKPAPKAFTIIAWQAVLV